MNHLSPRCAPGKFKLKMLILGSLVFLAACGALGNSQSDVVLLSPTPVIVEKTIIETIVLESPEPEERPLTKDITICLGEEPESLYRHGRLSRAETAVRARPPLARG